MIYTITLNPSIDYIVECDNFEIGATNRAKKEDIFIGGKGINVSVVLNNLGFSSIILGFEAGFSGQKIQEELSKDSLMRNELIHLDNGFTRINLKLKTGIETEINGLGPIVDEAAINKLYSKLSLLEDDDYLVLSGSIPLGLKENVYAEIISKIEKDVKIIVDARGELLLNTLRYQPFLIKPNKEELEELFKVKIDTIEEVIKYALKLKQMGAQNVLVSLADKGAILLTSENKLYQSLPIKGIIKNSVGAGDSMIAGFIYGQRISKKDYLRSFKYAVALATATVFSCRLASKEEMENIYKQLNDTNIYEYEGLK